MASSFGPCPPVQRSKGTNERTLQNEGKGGILSSPVLLRRHAHPGTNERPETKTLRRLLQLTPARFLLCTRFSSLPKLPYARTPLCWEEQKNGAQIGWFYLIRVHPRRALLITPSPALLPALRSPPPFIYGLTFTPPTQQREGGREMIDFIDLSRPPPLLLPSARPSIWTFCRLRCDALLAKHNKIPH